MSGIALSYRLDDRGFDSQQGLGIFLFTTTSILALESTQPSIQWVLGAFSLGIKCLGGGGVKLTTHLRLVPRSRMHGTIHPLPFYAFMAWCSVKAHGQLYINPQAVLHCEWSAVVGLLRSYSRHLGSWNWLLSDDIRVPEGPWNWIIIVRLFPTLCRHLLQVGLSFNSSSW
jgi:hypothetical protein